MTSFIYRAHTRDKPQIKSYREGGGSVDEFKPQILIFNTFTTLCALRTFNILNFDFSYGRKCFELAKVFDMGLQRWLDFVASFQFV